MFKPTLLPHSALDNCFANSKQREQQQRPKLANLQKDMFSNNKNFEDNDDLYTAPSSPSTEEDVDDDEKQRNSNNNAKYKKRVDLTKEEIEQYFHVSQNEAAKQMGISVSTLKRRFYELYANMRWPYHHAVHGPTAQKKKTTTHPSQQGSSIGSQEKVLYFEAPVAAPTTTIAKMPAAIESLQKMTLASIVNVQQKPEKQITTEEWMHLRYAFYKPATPVQTIR